jgi:hypothetical protein
LRIGPEYATGRVVGRLETSQPLGRVGVAPPETFRRQVVHPFVVLGQAEVARVGRCVLELDGQEVGDQARDVSH